MCKHGCRLPEASKARAPGSRPTQHAPSPTRSSSSNPPPNDRQILREWDRIRKVAGEHDEYLRSNHRNSRRADVSRRRLSAHVTNRKIREADGGTWKSGTPLVQLGGLEPPTSCSTD